MEPNEKQDPALTLEGVKNDVLAALNDVKGEWKTHYEELKKDGASHGEARKAIMVKVDNAIRRIDEAEAIMNRPGFVNTGMGGEVKSVGEIVIENEYVRKIFADGRGYDHRGKIEIPMNNLDIKIDGQQGGSFFPEQLGIVKALVPELKTTITSATVGSSTPGILVPQRLPGIVKPGIPRIRVRDLIPRLPTTNNAVEFVKENVFTSAASPQTEGSAKAESALTFTIDSEVIRTLAHWIPATRQVLDDFVGLGGYINVRLIDGLMDKEDAEILTGSDTGVHLKGLSVAGTAYTDATYDQTGDLALDKLVRMMTQIEDANLSPSGFILHPRDWRIIQTIKADYGGGTGTGPYVMGGPQSLIPSMCWGLPVATTTNVTAGTAFCGAFATHVILWDRMQARIDISTEHASYFTANMVAIRAEERVALTTLRSDAVIYESSI